MKSAGSTGCSVFLSLFALPFAACGVITSGLVFYTLLEWFEVRDWQETPATILTANVDSHGDSGSTEATYEYVWNGQGYTGDQVSLHSGSDNIGSFQSRVAHELTTAHKSGEPFRCYVDPSNPAASILYRDLRWEMIAFYSLFGTIFGTVGFGLLYASVMSIPQARKLAELQERYPDEPWYWKPEWAEGDIRGKAPSLGLLLLAIYWNVVVLPGGVGAVNSIAHGNLLSILGLILPGLAFLIARAAWRERRRFRIFGQSRVQLDRFPMITGGKTSGRVLLEKDVDPLAVWQLTLKGEMATQASGDDDSTDIDVVFELHQTCEGAARSEDWGRSSVPFEFELPYAVPQSSTAEGHISFAWKLIVKSERTEVVFDAEFPIPVFRTDESSSEFKDRDADHAAEGDRDARRLDELNPDGPLMEARLQIREHGDGAVTVIAPTARYRKVVVTLAAFAIFWDGICVALWDTDAPILFPIVFSLSGVFLTYCWFDILLNSSRVEIGNDTLTFRNGWPGLARERSISLDDIRDVDVTSNMSVGSTQFPNVRIKTASGAKHTVMKLIRGRPAADRMAERILEAVTSR